MNSKELQRLLIFYSVVRIFIISALVAIISIFPLYKELKKNEESNLHRTYAKTLYIAHDNFDELHALSHGIRRSATVCERLTILKWITRVPMT